MPQSLFRRSAVRAIEQRWFSTVLVITPPSTIPTVIMALVATAFLVVATVVIGYPLSAGPYLWLASKGVIGPTTKAVLGTFYWPLSWVMDNSEPCERLLVWFLGLWVP